MCLFSVFWSKASCLFVASEGLLWPHEIRKDSYPRDAMTAIRLLCTIGLGFWAVIVVWVVKVVLSVICDRGSAPVSVPPASGHGADRVSRQGLEAEKPGDTTERPCKPQNAGGSVSTTCGDERECLKKNYLVRRSAVMNRGISPSVLLSWPSVDQPVGGSVIWAGSRCFWGSRCDR